MKKAIGVLGALLFVAASCSASASYNFSVNSTTSSSLTKFSLTCTGMPATCAGISASQVSVFSGPAIGAVLSSISVGSTVDVAVFVNGFGQSWTFNLDTSAITSMGTFSFTSSSTVSTSSSGWLAVSGAVGVSKAMPESMTFWSLLLVLIPLFFVCLRQGRPAASRRVAL